MPQLVSVCDLQAFSRDRRESMHIAKWLEYFDITQNTDKQPIPSATMMSIIPAFMAASVCIASEIGPPAGEGIPLPKPLTTC